MTKNWMVLALGAVLAGAGATATGEDGTAPAAPATPWTFNATIIEACSCPMFCQCYFNTAPSAHHSHDGHGAHGGGATTHFCRFNNAFKVNKGSFGSTRLDGAKFWVGGDLGGDFSKGQMDWAHVAYDKSTSKAQRDAIGTILASVYPVKWNSFTSGEGDIAWSFDKNQAQATLDGGKGAEVRLKRFPGMTEAPVVIKNLKYWGVPRNDGFVLMPNEVEAWRLGDKPFEFKGTNGFMITLDMTSKDVQQAAK